MKSGLKNDSYKRVANPDSMDDAGLPSMALDAGFPADMMGYLNGCVCSKLVNMHLT